MPDPVILDRARQLAAAAPLLSPERLHRLEILVSGGTPNSQTAARSAPTALGGGA